MYREKYQSICFIISLNVTDFRGEFDFQDGQPELIFAEFTWRVNRKLRNLRNLVPMKISDIDKNEC